MNKAEREAYLKQRLFEMMAYEREYRNVPYVCGIDEVGRGPLAGPVVACAVILPKDINILGIDDSKKLSAKKRELLSDQIKDVALSYAFGVVDAQRIDEINILQATYEAMRQAVEHLSVSPNLLLNDAVTIPNIDIQQVPLIGGDGKSVSIAAASILAKVYRDELMYDYDIMYPGFALAKNAGYGTAAHYEGLRKLGVTPIHRKTFLKKLGDLKVYQSQ